MRRSATCAQCRTKFKKRRHRRNPMHLDFCCQECRDAFTTRWALDPSPVKVEWDKRVRGVMVSGGRLSPTSTRLIQEYLANFKPTSHQVLIVRAES